MTSNKKEYYRKEIKKILEENLEYLNDLFFEESNTLEELNILQKVCKEEMINYTTKLTEQAKLWML